MIISIRPWLEDSDRNQDCLPGGGDGLVALTSDAEMEELLQEAGRLDEWTNASRLNRMEFYHLPVLAREVLEALQPGHGKQFYDGTLGGGGHTELLLSNGAHVIGSDQDLDSIEYVSKKLSEYGDSFLPVHGNFSRMDELLASVGVDHVDGVLLDLGVSSHQLDEAERGFSFRNDGPLDMRMDQSCGMTAADLVNTADQEELIRIFREYGEENRAYHAAKAIVEARAVKKFERTSELADVIAKVIHKTGRNHPATKVFQALRIAVNDELGVLEVVLEKALKVLPPGGVLAVITFHSLEDRIVKQFMRARSEKMLDRPEWPEPKPNPQYCLDLPHRKPKAPQDDEVDANFRSRSAKLRVAIKV
ncbi:MAG: 16S rRNA (cytosine(1402)-N(4))-methyltransferase RsmH [Verrucomicrobiales bacterium]|nr:16S rRNA (cytosine(1402)-N(4))-methyltransferase RsmH [Verrucomicrobiales bacterium]